MKDLFLISAGSLGMLVAVVHCYIGATKVVGPLEIKVVSLKRVLHAIMFLSGVYWFVAGAVLVATPYYFDESGRFAAALVTGAVFLTSAMANFWATSGKHFGWMLLAVVCVLIALGV